MLDSQFQTANNAVMVVLPAPSLIFRLGKQ